MYHFGPASESRLITCHPKLQLIARGAILYRDFSIDEGHRGQTLQDFYYNEGNSKTPWPKSKHNTTPSRAFDAKPYPFNRDWWDSEKYFHIWAEWGSWMKGFAAGKGIKLRWGFDWDGDFDLKDQGFYDGPHFELDNEEE